MLPQTSTLVASTPDRVRIAERRVLSTETQLEEALFTGLRLVEGLDLDVVGRRYNTDVWARYAQSLQPSLDAGLGRP